MRWEAFAALVLLAAGPGAAAAPDPLAAVDAERRARVLDRDADRARAEAAQRDVERLRAELLALGRAEASGERTVGGARSQLRNLNLEEAELKVRMGRNQQALTKLLGALEMYQRHPPPPLLVDPRSARDAVRAAILIKAIAPELEARGRAFATQAEALKRVRRRAAETSGALFQAESDVADRQARIVDLIEQKHVLEAQLYSDADSADLAARDLARRARSLGAFVRSLDAGEGRAPGPAPAGQLYPAPVQGVLVRRFGDRGGDRLRGKGWTWITDPNAPVLSPVAGRVDYAGPLKDWGLVVILRVGEDDLVLVGLGALAVETGRTVAVGEPVGRMSDGAAADAHAAQGQGRPELYMELRRGAEPIDPARWFAAPAAEPDRRSG